MGTWVSKENPRRKAEQDLDADACNQSRRRQPSASPGVSVESIPANTSAASTRSNQGPRSCRAGSRPRITHVLAVHRPNREVLWFFSFSHLLVKSPCSFFSFVMSFLDAVLAQGLRGRAMLFLTFRIAFRFHHGSRRPRRNVSRIPSPRSSFIYRTKEDPLVITGCVRSFYRRNFSHRNDQRNYRVSSWTSLSITLYLPRQRFARGNLTDAPRHHPDGEKRENSEGDVQRF